MFLLFLLVPFLEIYVLFLASKHYGFFNVLLSLIFAAWLGLRIIKYSGLSWMVHFQVAGGESISGKQKAVNGFLLFLSGVLFIVPGFVSDLFGLIFLIPWTRKVSSLLITGWFEEKIKNGSFKVYSFRRAPSEYTVHSNEDLIQENQKSSIRDVTPKAPPPKLD